MCISYGEGCGDACVSTRDSNTHPFRNLIHHHQIDQSRITNDGKTTDPCAIGKRRVRKTIRKEEAHLLRRTAEHSHQRLFHQGDICGKPCLDIEIGPHKTANGDGACPRGRGERREGKSAKHGKGEDNGSPWDIPISIFLGGHKKDSSFMVHGIHGIQFRSKREGCGETSSAKCPHYRRGV